MEYKYRATPMFRHTLSTKKVMERLLICLVIVYLFGLWNASRYGFEYVVHALLILLVSLVCGIGTEVAYAYFTKQNIKEFVATSFSWITCFIIVEIVPCDVSLYAVGVTTILALFFGKLVYGGFGQNIFNPAAIGRCFLTTSFVSISSVDLITSATPVRTMSSLSWLMTPSAFKAFLSQYGGLQSLILGTHHGALGETNALLLIVLLIVMLLGGVVDYRVPITYIGICFISTWIIGSLNGLGIQYAIAFICTGGLLYGAVFMLTDPVTSPFSVPGRMVFASIAAVVTCLIRYLGNLPEGICYAILISNMLSPMLDKLFSCKQIDAYKKNSIITFSVIILSIVACVLTGMSVTPWSY